MEETRIHAPDQHESTSDVFVDEDVVVESPRDMEIGDAPLLDPEPNKANRPREIDGSQLCPKDGIERNKEDDGTGTEGSEGLSFVVKDPDDEGGVDERMTTLPEDTFSFVISSKPFSVPFATAMAVYALKTVIFYLVLVNLINHNAVFNKLGIPVSVDTAVVISQVLAFAISVMTQQDLVSALILAYQGYSPEMLEVFGRDGHGGGRKAQWVFAFFCAFSDGLFGLAVTFFLIVTSATVLDVLLNFAAVEFVSGLDDAAFYMAQKGFLGRLNKVETDIVAEGSYKVPRTHHKKGCGSNSHSRTHNGTWRCDYHVGPPLVVAAQRPLQPKDYHHPIR